jgi:hypothetical protein
VKIEYAERRAKDLEKAELVEWDGSMIFSEEVRGYRDGWFNSPDELLDCIDDEENAPQFAFLGRKRIKELDISRAIEQMTADTYDDAELHIASADWCALMAAVDEFNAKYAVTYYEHDYKKKVRLADQC